MKRRRWPTASASSTTAHSSRSTPPTILVASLGGSGTVTIEVAPTEALLASLREIPGVERVDATAGSVTVIASGAAAGVLVPVTQALAAAGIAPEGLALGEPSLEDVFISLTGRGLR